MDNFNFERVAPIRPAAPYIGGKRCLSKRVCALIEATPHRLYAEVFVGMGGIFLRRGTKPKAEVINDWSEDVSTFFRVLQHHFVPFTDMIRFQITSRAGFEKLVALNPDSLTDLQRSARFLYLQRVAFGGKVTGQNYGVSVERPGRFDVTKIVPMIEAIHERLCGVAIERLPWAEFIQRYDRPHALFYLDPPYFGNENDYGSDMFSRDDFSKMADILAKLKGKFILSINDRPEVRAIFSAFDIEPVRTRYTLAGNDNGKDVGELIIRN